MGNSANEQSQMEQEYMRLANDVNAMEMELLKLNDGLTGVLLKKYTLENYRNELILSDEEPELAKWPARIRGIAVRIGIYHLMIKDIRQNLAI
jgi:hypothetical protein